MRRLSASPPLPPAVGRPRGALPFPLDRSACRLYRLARHGLYEGVRALGLGRGDEALVPAYHHGSEVEALIRAGVRPRYYGCTERLEPDAAQLEDLMGPSVRALHLIHYLGWPQDAPRWRRWADERGLLLIEDAAQSWLTQVEGLPVGSWGDLAIFSLYKSFGVPDGGAMIARVPPRAPEGRPAVETLRAARAFAQWFAARIPLPPFPPRRERPYDAEQDFALGAPRPPSRATRWLVPRVADPQAAPRRRRNHAVLARDLPGRVLPALADAPPGSSPFLFPILVESRGAVRARLRARGVASVELWSVPHGTLPVEGFPREADLRARVLGLPVHQELRASDLERIVAAVVAAQ